VGIEFTDVASCVPLLTTLQGAYIILQSLSLKIALQKCRCFWPGHVHISLHCIVAGSKMPCNALRSFYEMKPSSADFQNGTVRRDLLGWGQQTSMGRTRPSVGPPMQCSTTNRAWVLPCLLTVLGHACEPFLLQVRCRYENYSTQDSVHLKLVHTLCTSLL
jgi:hypothetical protein